MPSSAIVCCPIVGKVGGVFTSVTTTLKLLVTLAIPSDTTVVIVLVDGPWASLGVNVMTPCALMLALAGGLRRL